MDNWSTAEDAAESAGGAPRSGGCGVYRKPTTPAGRRRYGRNMVHSVPGSLIVTTLIVALVAGCGQATLDNPPTTIPAAVPVAAQGAPTACLSAALIAPPAWKGYNLNAEARARIGARFVQLSDECLAAPAGTAPIECLRATEALELYRDSSKPSAEIDAEYLRNWRVCTR